MKQAVQEGFTECFKVTARGLYAITQGRYYRPEQTKLIRVFRFDAPAEPTGVNRIYMLETSDGIKGTLVMSDCSITDGLTLPFINEVEDIQRKIVRHNQHEC